MQLSSYISELLYRYECVIVPNFGGFISKVVSSKIEESTNTFYPPTKQISFNSQLKNNDGLLANYIATTEKCSYETAIEKINNLVFQWNNELNTGVLTLNKIGNLSLTNEGKIAFEPFEITNYLTSSFGLESIQSAAITREVYKQKAAKLNPNYDKKSIGFYKYAAAVAVLLTVGFAGWTSFESKQFEALQTEYNTTVTKKIQEATFIINNPLPEITLDLVKTTSSEKIDSISTTATSSEIVPVENLKYHIIAGAYEHPANAQKKVDQLTKMGYHSTIIGKNKFGLTQVTFESYADLNKANKELKLIQKTDGADAWLLIN